MSEFGFDEGSLFDTMSKPKLVETKYWYDDDGNVIKKREKIVSYWDAVMAAGGPAIIFLIVGLIKVIATRGPDWYTDEEQKFIKKYPWAFLALGPVGFKVAYKKAEFAGTLYDDLAGEKGNMITTSPERWLAQMKENWGIANQTTFDTVGGGVPESMKDPCHRYHGIDGPLTAEQYEECRQKGLL